MNKKIAVAETGYVGLSIATLLAQHNQVKAVDIIPEKVELMNNPGQNPLPVRRMEITNPFCRKWSYVKKKYKLNMPF